ncbi:C6 finger domain-containing protein, variant [Trichophyton interdigitale]|uniref:C6 finger domain-containing protein, variant n=2 Tax=Trichophyton interdigitale TaxID=101480 RepID=A0A9P4YL73_9EURO|nr:C6 finger domain-containing protein, variant [Trichophyton interdigitale]KAF3898515.1 C6 finger domain-containing protein, variant [Trichophyton interdigitale]KAG8212286.1 C6 finger domain-containing protein, variant [Trichophyton interdigitale]
MMDPKRPRSPCGGSTSDHPAKQPKTTHPHPHQPHQPHQQPHTQHQQHQQHQLPHQHLQINYLARQYSDTLPLVSTDDTLPAILRWIGEYDGVLHRHESIAGNLGACPLGPILVKRFERLFDGPPRVIRSASASASGGAGGAGAGSGDTAKETTVSWLDIVEFAKEFPDKFTLEKARSGSRVCQLDIKHARVEISEEDYVLIASGMPQKMIPPQPISEDEEKELGALEILEKNLVYIIQLADQVSARARQLNHRLKNRRNAIVSRRENDASLALSQTRAISPWKDSTTPNGHGQSRTASPPGFVAVNSRQDPASSSSYHDEPAQFAFSQPISDNVTIINGTSIKGASPSTRAELMKKFFTTSDRRMHQQKQQQSDHHPDSDQQSSSSPFPGQANSSIPPVPIPSTPSSLLPHPKPTPSHDRDETAPFKAAMVARMEDLARGERILPPCDRCRRLNMHCLKNLTACMGCTKKHAKCSWRDVKAEELQKDHPKDRAASQDAPTTTATATTREKDRDISEDVSASTSAPDDRGKSSPAKPAATTTTTTTITTNTANGTTNTGRNSQRHDRNASTRLDDDSSDVLAQAIMDTFDHHRQRTAERERTQQQQQQEQQQQREKDRDREKNRERGTSHVVEAR